MTGTVYFRCVGCRKKYGCSFQDKMNYCSMCDLKKRCEDENFTKYWIKLPGVCKKCQENPAKVQKWWKKQGDKEKGKKK